MHCFKHYTTFLNKFSDKDKTSSSWAVSSDFPEKHLHHLFCLSSVQFIKNKTNIEVNKLIAMIWKSLEQQRKKNFQNIKQMFSKSFNSVLFGSFSSFLSWLPRGLVRIFVLNSFGLCFYIFPSWSILGPPTAAAAAASLIIPSASSGALVQRGFFFPPIHHE